MLPPACQGRPCRGPALYHQTSSRRGRRQSGWKSDRMRGGWTERPTTAQCSVAGRVGALGVKTGSQTSSATRLPETGTCVIRGAGREAPAGPRRPQKHPQRTRPPRACHPHALLGRTYWTPSSRWPSTASKLRSAKWGRLGPQNSEPCACAAMGASALPAHGPWTATPFGAGGDNADRAAARQPPQHTCGRGGTAGPELSAGFTSLHVPDGEGTGVVISALTASME